MRGRLLPLPQALFHATRNPRGTLSDTRHCALRPDHHDSRLSFHGFLDLARHELLAARRGRVVDGVQETMKGKARVVMVGAKSAASGVVTGASSAASGISSAASGISSGVKQRFRKHK